MLHKYSSFSTSNILTWSSLATLSLQLFSVTAQQQQRICNNSPDLCDRKYNEITYLGAHDSPFVRNESNSFNPFGDQYFNSTVQLDAGVRLLQAQVHQNNTSWDLCHTACEFLDAGSLTSWLGRLKSWLDAHPNDVVTILLVNSDDADADTLNQQFEAADIVDYAYTPSSTTTATTDWPTLNEMIDQNKRLVTFIASLSPSSNTVAPYLLDEFTFIFENNYDVTNPADFTCGPNRPTTLQTQSVSSVLSAGYMPLTNHFLYNNISGIESAAEDKVNTTNAASGGTGNLGDALNNCTSFYGGQAPTFVLVDFFNVADAMVSVDRVNDVLGSTVERIDLPGSVQESRLDLNPDPAGSSSSSASTSGGTSTASRSSSASATASSSSSASASASSNAGHKFVNQDFTYYASIPMLALLGLI